MRRSYRYLGSVQALKAQTAVLIAFILLPNVVWATNRWPLTVQDGLSIEATSGTVLQTVYVKLTGVNEEIFFAEVACQCELPVGSRVELWATEEDGVTPDSTLGYRMWIVDERTAPRVRFDITELAILWDINNTPPGNLLVLAYSADGESISVENAGQRTTVQSPELIVHTRPRSVQQPLEQRNRDNRHGGRAEDGRSN